MLRRHPGAPDAPDPGADDTRPMILPGGRPLAGSAASTSTAPPTPMRERLRAAAIHFGLSAAAAAGVLALVFLAWYPSPLHTLLGVGAILLIMLAVDVTLGPLFTLLVFDRRKRSLALDLAVIAMLQVGALAYGLHAVYQGRPAFLVFVKDRFETVAPSELRIDAKAAARGNAAARLDPWAPRWVAARLPASVEERSAILFEAVSFGRDVQHHPRLYVDYASEARAAVERSLPIARLREINPPRVAEIDAALRTLGRAEGSLRYLPLRGPARDGAVLIDARDGSVLKVLSVSPW